MLTVIGSLITPYIPPLGHRKPHRKPYRKRFRFVKTRDQSDIVDVATEHVAGAHRQLALPIPHNPAP